jgi:hypothetical protein
MIKAVDPAYSGTKGFEHVKMRKDLRLLKANDEAEAKKR